MESSLFIEGRLWFDKVNGNTYWSSQAQIDGVVVMQLGVEYGYDEHFVYQTLSNLFKAGLIPTESRHELRNDYGWTIYTAASYGLKREMYAARMIGV